MIKKLLSRYSPRYVRELVYMMQASEYYARDYLRWYHRARNFGAIEYRKRLEVTPKATILLISAWMIVLAALAVIVFGVRSGSDIPLFVAIGLIVTFPFLLAYAMLVPLIILNIIQIPIEIVIVERAKRVLENHKGIRIGIAGSYGKTSMREILKTVLGESKRVAAPSCSYNTPLGISKFVNNLNGDEEILIFELGEYYPGDVWKLCKLVEPQIGIITGINEAHLERFGTLEKTAKTIFELAEYLKDKPVYVNCDNELARKKASLKHIKYTRAGAGSCHVFNPKTGIDGTFFRLSRHGQKIDASSRLLGLHNLGPMAVAAEIAFGLGLTAEQISLGISKTKPFEHRLEAKDSDGVMTIDDSYNGNPDGVTAAITFLASLTGCRRWYVTPGLVEMGSKQKIVHKEIGKKLAQAGIERVVLIKNSVTPYIEEGLKEAGYRGEVIWFDDGPTAYSALPHMTVGRDIVLLQNDWPDQYE